MAHPSHRPDLFLWKRVSKPGTQASSKAHLAEGDINTWIKKVEMASEFAVSEVFSSRKKHNGKTSHTVALQSTDQLQDHDDAFSEAQTILSDWMNKKLRLELEVDEEEDEEERIGERPANLNYKNFNGIYSQLTCEDESFEVSHFLQDLMEKDVMRSEAVQGLWLDADDEKKRGRDPNVTMEVRHQQVKERRAQREAEQEARKEALAEVKRLECEEQRKREKEAQRQDALLQQEVVRLRKLMREKRSTEQQGRKRDPERLENRNGIKNTVTPKPGFVTQRQLRYREQEVEAKICTLNLQCMHKHFSAWYSLVLERRMRLGKAAALCDWRRQLRAWRAWRELVWERKKEKEAERIEEELRLENRRCQLAEESDRRRLLRRCLGDWRLWCRMERERRDLLRQQEETRRKMMALIDAAASGKLTTKNCFEPPITVQPESMNQSENPTQQAQVPVRRAASASSTPTQAWQVTRRHAAVSLAEVREGQKPSSAPRCQSAEMRGGRYDHRHLAQQRTIAEQKRRLKEQQDIISELQERQKILELRQEAEKAEQLAVQLKPFPLQSVFKASHGSKGERGGASRPAPKEHDSHLASPPSSLRGMEERARQRAERRRELEEIKRKREEEKRAQMKAEEEERQTQERIEAERKKEEWRKKKEREIEKQRRAELEQNLLKQAGEHYLRSLLLYKGIRPWKRLVKQSHANDQKAEVHHTQALQRRCFLHWRHTTDESLAEKKSHADQLYERILLQRAVSRWKMFKLLQSHLEVQAEHFHAIQIQRKVLKVLLDYAMQQRLEGWDKEQRADEYSARRVVSRCFAAWRRLPATLQEQREREDRREQLRRRVSEILPDFRPPPVDDVWSSASHG